MKRQNQDGFITMIVMILAVLVFVIGFVFLRVLKANN
jgi:heme/copper-type cytochrome/quinol oxidase subunit 2